MPGTAETKQLEPLWLWWLLYPISCLSFLLKDGKEAKMLLKSLVKRSFIYNISSLGAGRFNMFEVAFIASTISEITLKALGPDEQPKSAIPIFIIGHIVVEHRISTIAFFVAWFVNNIIFLCKFHLHKLKHICIFSIILCVCCQQKK